MAAQSGEESHADSELNILVRAKTFRVVSTSERVGRVLLPIKHLMGSLLKGVLKKRDLKALLPVAARVAKRLSKNVSKTSRVLAKVVKRKLLAKAKAMKKLAPMVGMMAGMKIKMLAHKLAAIARMISVVRSRIH